MNFAIQYKIQNKIIFFNNDFMKYVQSCFISGCAIFRYF